MINYIYYLYRCQDKLKSWVKARFDSIIVSQKHLADRGTNNAHDLLLPVNHDNLLPKGL